MHRSATLALLVGGLLALFIPNGAAQEITLSPLTRYGYGQPTYTTPVAYRGMGGVGIGMKSRTAINFTNPASYVASDSLSFLFDMATTLNYSRYYNNSNSQNALLGNLDYIALQAPVYRNSIVVSLGFVPFTRSGYGIRSAATIQDETLAPGEDQSPYSIYQQYNGTGSLQSAYLGVGVKVFKGLSLGLNAKYFFGTLAHSVVNTPSSSHLKRTSQTYAIEMAGWTADFGAQYSFVWGKRQENNIIIGTTFAPSLPLTPTVVSIVNNNVGSTTKPDISSTTTYPSTSAPLKAGFGFSYNREGRLLVAGDAEWTQWSGVNNIFGNDKVTLTDTYRIALGGEYRRSAESREWQDLVAYRAGVNFETAYMNIASLGKLDKLTGSLGIGLPIFVYNERPSYVNISLEYVKGLSSQPKIFNEDVLRLTVGMTFGEAWFRKIKIH